MFHLYSSTSSLSVWVCCVKLFDSYNHHLHNYSEHFLGGDVKRGKVKRRFLSFLDWNLEICVVKKALSKMGFFIKSRLSIQSAACCLHEILALETASVVSLIFSWKNVLSIRNPNYFMIACFNWILLTSGTFLWPTLLTSDSLSDIFFMFCQPKRRELSCFIQLKMVTNVDIVGNSFFFIWATGFPFFVLWLHF